MSKDIKQKTSLHLLLLWVPTHLAEISSISFLRGHACPTARDLPYLAWGVLLQRVFAMHYWDNMLSKVLIVDYQGTLIFCSSNFAAEAFLSFSVILSYHIVARTGGGSREIQTNLSSWLCQRFTWRNQWPGFTVSRCNLDEEKHYLGSKLWTATSREMLDMTVYIDCTYVCK